MIDDEQIMETVEFQLHIDSVTENESSNNGLSNDVSCNNTVTSFENIIFFLTTHKYPEGLNLNQKRTLRKAAANFSFIDDKLYYIGKNRKDRRLVILDEEGKKQVFEDCHGSTTVGEHGGQKKTLEKIESLFFWRGMVKDVVNWIQACEVCQLKEERRGLLNKKVKKTVFNESSDHSVVCVDDAVIAVESTSSGFFEAVKYNMEQIELSLQKTRNSEHEIIHMSQRAEFDIDDVLDFLLSKIIKFISKKKREMKAQVEEQKTRSLNSLKTYRKQLEGRLRTIKKLMLDVEKASRETEPYSTFVNKSVVTASLPELPQKEDIGGIWTVFHTEVAQREMEKIITSCGSISEQPPYKISGVLQLPASLRLNISHEHTYPSLKETQEVEYCIPKSLRFYHCIHDSSITDVVFHENQIQISECLTTEAEFYLDRLEPRQIYAVYISHREEGTSDWSPWSSPFLASTAIPAYSWDTINGDWHVSSDLKEITKITDSLTPLYSASAQYFPGCRINLKIQELPPVQHDNDGFALIDQWVQGGTLNQDGTLFVNVEGKLFVNGKFAYAFDPFSNGSTLTLDCQPRIETTTDGVTMQLTIAYHDKSHLVYWTVRNPITNVYFGVCFHQQGTRLKIE